MSLDHVILGGPHVAAHNEERDAINALQDAVNIDIPADIALVSGMPSYVGARTKLFDPALSLYNGTVDKLRAFTAGAARARRGGTFKLTFVGDSTTAGWSATALTSYPLQIRDLLVASGCPIKGTGLVYAGQGVPDSRWSSSGTFTDWNHYSQMEAGATKTFVSDVPGDSVAIRFWRNSGTFVFKIDNVFIPAGQVTLVGATYNAATGTVTPDGSPSSQGLVTITGLAPETHTVFVSSNAELFYIGTKVEMANGPGVSVNNTGVGGSTTANWVPSGGLVKNYPMSILEPTDGFIVALGINDNPGVPVDTFKTNLMNIVTSYLTIAPVVLVAQHNNNVRTIESQRVYVSAIYDVADALNVPVVDMMYHWGGATNAIAWGLLDGDVHPNPQGYNDYAETVYSALRLGNSQVDVNAKITAASGLPAYVGARAKQFDPSLSLYNSGSDKLRAFRAFVARSRKGGTFKLTTIGDSTTAGSGSDYLQSFPLQLRTMLAAAGSPIKGTGAVYAGQGVTDPRWTSTGTNTSLGAMCQMGAGATRTFTSDLPGDTAVIKFYRTSGSWNFKVDGAFIAAGQVTVVGGSYTAATGTVTPDGASSMGTVTITGLTPTTHAILCTAVGTLFWVTVKVELSASNGISVSNMGIAASKTSDWTATGFVTDYQMATAEAADAFIVALGINDNNSISVATMKTNLTTILTNLLAIGPVILVAQHNNSAFPAASQQAYVSGIYDVADSLDVPVIDIMHRWQSYFNANSWGLVADAVHPNSKGYNDWASTIYGALDVGPTIVLPLSATRDWAANTEFLANQLIRLPTGGLGYSLVDYTTRASFDATERDAWTFVAGGHTERLSGASNWKCPAGISKALAILQGGGGGGGGAGSATAGTGTLQTGGGGGAAGARNEFLVSSLVPGTNYAYSVGAGGTHGAGGAIGATGTLGGSGGNTTFTGPGGTVYTAPGGSGGGNSGANSTAAATGGAYGVQSLRTITTYVPGCGGYTSTGGGAAPLPIDSVIGGAGGGAATATLGGAGGNARTAPGASVTSPGTGGAGGVAGTAGQTATEPGCGGGGGGGGSGSGTGGAGGNGGDGAAGYVEMRF